MTSHKQWWLNPRLVLAGELLKLFTMKKHNCITLADGSGIEVNVGYNYTRQLLHEYVPEFGNQVIGQQFDAELTSVEIVIAGKGIDIISMLNEKQKNAIIDQLENE